MWELVRKDPINNLNFIRTTEWVAGLIQVPTWLDVTISRVRGNVFIWSFAMVDDFTGIDINSLDGVSLCWRFWRHVCMCSWQVWRSVGHEGVVIHASSINPSIFAHITTHHCPYCHPYCCQYWFQSCQGWHIIGWYPLAWPGEWPTG